MKNLLFGWVGKKITEITLIDYIMFNVELIIFIILVSLLIAFVICKIDDMKFKKKWGIK